MLRSPRWSGGFGLAKSRIRASSRRSGSKTSRTRSGSSRRSRFQSSSYLEALPKDFREFLLSLIEHRVKFLLVGGHAVALHGAPRATFDLDVFVAATKRNLENLAKALSAFGFPASARAVAYLEREQRFLMLGEKPLRIDILNALSGVSFAEAWRTRVIIKARNFSLSILGLQTLIKNKRASGRTKDLLDIELLHERGAKT